MYNIYYSDIVIKQDVPKLSPPVKLLIQEAINSKLMRDPLKFGKPLRYNLKNCRSLRCGDYRIIYQILQKKINILVIKHRRDCYS